MPVTIFFLTFFLNFLFITRIALPVATATRFSALSPKEPRFNPFFLKILSRGLFRQPAVELDGDPALLSDRAGPAGSPDDSEGVEDARPKDGQGELERDGRVRVDEAALERGDSSPDEALKSVLTTLAKVC